MKRTAAVVTLLLAAVAAHPVAADTYPSKPIRMLVGFPPGGGTDIMARLIGAKLTESWGQQVIVDNKGGAAGTIAAAEAARASPDGYTLLMGHVNSNAIAPSYYQKLPYNAEKDFAPVTLVAAVPNMLVLHPGVPAKSVKELVELPKTKHGQLSFASAGPGSSQHLAGKKIQIHGQNRHRARSL
jgi:tripartite-type tricarboxylate transporter receptor subunit TctC